MSKSPRPNSVPKLELDKLVGEHPEDGKHAQPIKKSHAVQSPTARSDISWGTSLSAPYALTSADIRIGRTVHRPCTHITHGDKLQTHQTSNATNVNRRKDNGYDFMQDKPQKATLKNVKNTASYQTTYNNPAINKHLKAVVSKSHVDKEEENMGAPGVKDNKSTEKNKSKYWYLDEDMVDKPPSPKEVDTGYTVDDMAKFQTEYTSKPYTGLHELRKYAAEEQLIQKQKQDIIEQVLIDQLSKHVISDAEQDKDPSRQNPCDPSSNINAAPLRFRSRRLHNTQVSTVGASTESKLKSRTTFGGRIITRDGRDALRELFGFYFHIDQTLTVYEYRRFGKNTNKALPLIERGKYCHVVGRRKGKQYSAVDFGLGRNISFSTKNLAHLPDSLKQNPTLVIRICEVTSSQTNSNWDLESSDRGDGSDTALERNDRKITLKVQSLIRQKIGDRSVSIVVGLGKLFRQLDRSGDGRLDKQELQRAMEKFNLTLPPQDFQAVWRVVDENNDGAIDYGEFMRSFIGEMNETRNSIVRKVFKKIDPHKTGYVKLLDMQKLYCVKNHPLVVADKFSETEMKENFMTSFNELSSKNNGQISYVEFDEYYEGVSLTVANDGDFINMMRNCWGV
nr:calcyphosin-2 [Ciona intestinalis]|eukprot:XP_002126284.1 calcyphosin-2 [Ciona intestinalis]